MEEVLGISSDGRSNITNDEEDPAIVLVSLFHNVAQPETMYLKINALSDSKQHECHQLQTLIHLLSSTIVYSTDSQEHRHTVDEENFGAWLKYLPENIRVFPQDDSESIGNHLHHYFPQFLLYRQNFKHKWMGDHASPKAYLDANFFEPSHECDHEATKINDVKQIASTIYSSGRRDIFLTPKSKNPQYHSKVAKLRQYLSEQAPMKVVDQNSQYPINGTVFVSLLDAYIRDLNRTGIPFILPAIRTSIHFQRQTITQEAVNIYERNMRRNLEQLPSVKDNDPIEKKREPQVAEVPFLASEIATEMKTQWAHFHSFEAAVEHLDQLRCISSSSSRELQPFFKTLKDETSLL